MSGTREPPPSAVEIAARTIADGLDEAFSTPFIASARDAVSSMRAFCAAVSASLLSGAPLDSGATQSSYELGKIEER